MAAAPLKVSYEPVPINGMHDVKEHAAVETPSALLGRSTILLGRLLFLAIGGTFALTATLVYNHHTIWYQ